MNNNKWTVSVDENEAGETILPFPADMIEKLNWYEGDIVEFNLVGDDWVITNLSWEERQRGTHQG